MDTGEEKRSGFEKAWNAYFSWSHRHPDLLTGALALTIAILLEIVASR